MCCNNPSSTPAPAAQVAWASSSLGHLCSTLESSSKWNCSLPVAKAAPRASLSAVCACSRAQLTGRCSALPYGAQGRPHVPAK